MAKNSKNQQDDQKRDDESVELPEDRLEQLEQENKPEKEKEEESQDETPVPGEPEQVQGQEEAEEKVVEEEEVSREDLLDDVRRSLADEEEDEEPKGFFGRLRQRFSRSSKAETKEPEQQLEIEELETHAQEQDDTDEALQAVLDDLVVEAKPEPKPELKPKPKSKKKRTAKDKEEEKAIQDFFADLEAMADVVPEEGLELTTEEDETEIEAPQVEEKVKVPKLPARSETEDEVDFDAVREAALEEYDETRIEPEEKKPPLREEVRRSIRELKPAERFLLIAFGVLTVGVLLFSGVFLIANSISIPTPTPTPELDLSEIVHPTQLTLPGGWEFNLGEGRVSEGQWSPDRAEWLVGTEISRWVALPWSLQLEAVLRTLTAEDQIELTMSNFDVLTFNVYSIQQMTMAELLATDPTEPGLIVVLYNDEEEDGTYWTVRALPARNE